MLPFFSYLPELLALFTSVDISSLTQIAVQDLVRDINQESRLRFKQVIRKHLCRILSSEAQKRIAIQ